MNNTAKKGIYIEQSSNINFKPIFNYDANINRNFTLVSLRKTFRATY